MERSFNSMTTSELLDIVISDLKSQNINTLDEFSTFIKANKDFSSVNVTQAYLNLLRDELSTKHSKLPAFTVSSIVGQDLAYKYANLDHEELHLLCLDTPNNLIGDYVIFVGSKNRALADPQRIFRKVIQENCDAFMLMHNHPSGMLTPSESDIKFTEKISNLSQALNIRFLDHFIIGDGMYYSMSEGNFIS